MVELPHDNDLEQSLLGMILIDADAAQEIMGLAAVADFYGPANRAVYEACVGIARSGQITDLVTVSAAMREAGTLADVGGVPYLMAMGDAVSTTANRVALVAKLTDYTTRRRIVRAAWQAQEAAVSGEPVAASLDAIEESFYAIRERRTTAEVRSIGDILPEVLHQIERRYDGEDEDALTTLIPDLDAMLGGGFRESELVIVAGRPGMGKSAICGDMAAVIAGTHKRTTLVFTLEMSNSQIVQRLLARQSRVNGMRLQLGHVHANEWTMLNAAMKSMTPWPLFFQESPDMSPIKMRAECRRVQRKHGLGFVIVDHLGLMDGDSATSENRVQEVSKITRSLKKLAKEFKIPVAALCQLNRSVESRPNKRPMLSDLRDSGSIEQDADKVLMLYRDEYYNPDSDSRNMAEVLVTKHRNGPTGTVKVFYNKELASFEPAKTDWGS